MMSTHRKTLILLAILLLNSSNAPSRSSQPLGMGSIQQQLRPLSLEQIQDLIRNSTPDAAIAIEIQQRGIAFQLDSKALDNLRKFGAGPKTVRALSTQLQRVQEKVVPCQSDLGKIVVLVANFKSIDDTENSAVTELILDQLREATREYQDIEVQALNESITAQQGRDVALAKGREKNATIVLWGWHKRSREKLILTAHFELTREVPRLALRGHQERRVFALPEIESFTVQTQVSKQMTYLTLLATGLARFELDDYDGAIDRFTKALRDGALPEQIVGPSLLFSFRGISYYLKATFGSGANRALQSGIADLQKAVDLDPEEPKSHLMLAFAYSQHAELEKALASADRAVSLRLGEDMKAAAFCLMVMINRRLGRNDKADEYASLAVKTLESLPPSELKFNFLSQVYLYSNDPIRAVTNLDQASKLATCTTAKGIYSYMRGMIYASANSLDKAISEFDSAIRMLPEFSYAYWLRGHAYFEKNQYDQAISDYSQAIRLNPDDAIFYDDRGDAYGELDRLQDAITDYEKATVIDPSFSIAFYDLGLAYSRQGQVNEAIESFSRYIKLEPRDFDGYRNRAQLYEKKTEYDLAITDLKTASEQTNDPQLKKFAQAYIGVLVSEKELKELENKKKSVKPE